jgi:hypothetical protein
VSVSTEVPVDADNYLLVRNADNYYWPSMVEVAGRSMVSADARELAAALIQAADKADELDDAASPVPSAGGQQQ